MARKRANGEGTICPRKDSTTGRVLGYMAAISLEGGRRRYLYGKTRPDVAKKLADALKAKDEGLPVVPRMFVSAWLDYWLEQVVKPEREPTTYEGYEIAVRRYLKPHVGSYQLARLQPEHVEMMLRNMEADGKGARTRQVVLARLRTALNLAMRRGHVRRNVAALVDMPKSTCRKVSPPRLDDLRRLLDTIHGDRYEALVTVGLALGLRRGEALGLRWDDVDLDARTLTVRARVSRVRKLGLIVREGAKTESGVRTVVLPQIVVQALRAHRIRQLQDRLAAGPLWKGPEYAGGELAGYVFTSAVGTLLEPRNVNRYLSDACQRAGLSARSPHALRHDFASLLLASGVAGRVVMEMMGHSSYTLTANRYQHVPDVLQREAADRIDTLLSAAS